VAIEKLQHHLIFLIFSFFFWRNFAEEKTGGVGCESQPTNIWLGDIFHKILNLNCLCKGTFCCKFDNFLGGKSSSIFQE
jgi:hypothetical protein